MLSSGFVELLHFYLSPEPDDFQLFIV